MCQLVHALHLLLSRHLVPLSLGDSKHFHLLFATHLCPFQRIVAIWARQYDFTTSFPSHSFTNSSVTRLLHLVHHRLAICTSPTKKVNNGAIFVSPVIAYHCTIVIDAPFTIGL